MSFVHGYIECALWASNDITENGEDIRMEDYELSDSARETLTEQALAFENANADLLEQWYDLGVSPDYAGHDYWLTRNRHGAGFWDRFMNEPGQTIGRQLTDLAHADGECNLYLGDDELIYVQ